MKLYDALFDAKLLEGILPKLADGLKIRPLQLNDYHCGFLQLLTQLTSVGEVSFDKFKQQFQAMKTIQPQTYYVIVIEDQNTGDIVGASTLVIELKFIHEAGCRGRVEDVVVASSKRGLKLGAALNGCLVALAKKLNVYKLSLECKDSLIGFYEQFGYKVDKGNNFLVQRFDSKI